MWTIIQTAIVDAENKLKPTVNPSKSLEFNNRVRVKTNLFVIV